jgi:K+-transporting ATPase ATPase C chain
MEAMKTNALIALKLLLVMTILTGVIYPVLITGLSQLFFSQKANGSLVKKNGIVMGSALIGQQFDSAAYFWSRPSSINYNPLPSGGSNLGPSSSELKLLITERRKAFITENDISDSLTVPSEMLCASASGLDPDISPRAAYLQVNRIATARGFDASRKRQLIALIGKITEKPQFSLLGENRINVFLLNLELDKIK